MSDGRFDPTRLARLRARTAAALDELAELRSHDPAAATAMRAVRLTRSTLEWFWMPAIEQLLASVPETERAQIGMTNHDDLMVAERITKPV